MVGRQPYRGISRRLEYRAICGDIYAIEADIGLQHMGWRFGGRYSAFDGLGSSGGAECYRERRLERAPVQRVKYRGLASRWATLRLAISALQWLKLDHPRRVQACRSSNASMDQSKDERPCSSAVRNFTLPHLHRPVVVWDHRSRILGDKQHRQRVDRAQGLEILEKRGTAGKCAGLVLG